VRIASLNSDSNAAPASVVGKVFLSLFLSVFALAGTFFLVTMIGTLWQHVAVLMWDATPCTIVSSKAVEKERAFKVTYRYTHEGDTHTSDVFQLGYSGSSKFSEASRLVGKYPEGADATCYVNSSDPTQAALERKTDELMMLPFMLIPLVFIAVGVGGIYAVWRGKKKRKRSDGTEAPESISQKPAGRNGGCFLVVFCSVFFLIGALVLFFMFIRPMMRSRAAGSWAETPCAILHSEVTTHSDSDGATYGLDMLYEYHWRGQRHESDRYSFYSVGSSSSRGWREAVVKRLPKGAKTVCYVNPSNPTEAVLSREMGPDMWFALIPAVFMLFGGVGIVFAVRHMRKKSSGGLTTGRGVRRRVAPAKPTPAEPERVPVVDEVVLKPGSSPLGKLIGIICIALFWNGIVSVFVYQVVTGWQRGQAPWFLTLFMIPFVLIGLGLIGGVFYQALALLNPRPRVIVRPGAVPLGGAFEVEWQMTGNVGRIGKLTITLEGREEATYRRGTNTYTDKNVFATIPVAETTNARDMQIGAARPVVPANTMHTFEGPNNKIIWRLKLNGDIRRWPDINEEFKITVLPVEEEEF
jgi:uncharacterized protein DUF3592